MAEEIIHIMLSIFMLVLIFIPVALFFTLLLIYLKDIFED